MEEGGKKTEGPNNIILESNLKFSPPAIFFGHLYFQNSTPQVALKFANSDDYLRGPNHALELFPTLP